MSEHEALDAIEATYDRLDLLGPRFATANPPAPGSVLAADDATLPRQPLTELARGSLAAAWDHFTCLRLIVESRRGFVTATGSVARGALVSSAQALWLLHSDDAALRRERGLMLAQEWYRRRIQYQRDLTPTLASVADRQRSQTQLAILEQDLAAVRAARTSRVELNVTSIIETAADVRFGNARLTAEALLEWCRLGAVTRTRLAGS